MNKVLPGCHRAQEENGLRKLESILNPYPNPKEGEFNHEKGPFIHYTSAKTAYSIIKNKTVWLRNASLMNDASEVKHGYQMLMKELNGPYGRNFWKPFKRHCPNIEVNFNAISKQLLDGHLDQTYILCLSEHHRNEHETGRLSMWRAYGNNCGVAFVLDPQLLVNETSPPSNLTFYPVKYFNDLEFRNHFNVVTSRLHESVDEICIEPSRLVDHINLFFRYLATCVKHPAFSEEREWRILANPATYEAPLLTQSIEVVGNSPQVVYKLKLDSHFVVEGQKVELSKALRSILIGPCEFPKAAKESFRKLLDDANMAHVGVEVTDIPLRLS